MKHVDVCGERDIEAMCRAIRASALGQRVSFEIEGGVTRHREGERVVDVPNGTLSIRVFVNGGAVTLEAPAREVVPA